MLAENSISDYLKKRLQKEEDRIDRYLNAGTRKLLISKCEHVLVRQHAALLSRTPEELEPLRKRFEEHVKKAGQDVVGNVNENKLNACVVS